jgi:hypoxanthine phosphoribosyltransferase
MPIEKNSTFTGGIFVGGGIEIFPAKVISGFLQVSAGYTAPISYINTSYYNIDNNLEKLLEKGIETYPVIKKGFTSVNVQLGVAFNF